MPFPGMPPMPGPMPGMSPMGDQSMPELAMSSLDQLQGGKNPASEALSRVDEVLNLAHKLMMSVLPQVSSVNPQVAKDLHQIAQRVLQVKLDVQKNMPMGDVPPELMSLLDSTGQEQGAGLTERPTPSPSPMFGG